MEKYMSCLLHVFMLKNYWKIKTNYDINEKRKISQIYTRNCFFFQFKKLKIKKIVGKKHINSL